MQAAQIGAVRFVPRRAESGGRLSMSSCGNARAISANSCGRSAAGRRAEQLDRGGKLAVPAIDRRIELVGPMDQKGRGDDQMDRDDRGDHQRGDLSADPPQIEKAEQLHAGRCGGDRDASTSGVNI